MKICASCAESKEKTEYSVDNRRKGGLHAYCNSCRSVKRKKAWAGDVGERGRNRALLKNYGITLEAKNAIIAAQGGHCALCERTEGMCIDHCHVTNKIRGVLCRKCNLMLGHADDSVAKLAAAIIYLGK